MMDIGYRQITFHTGGHYPKSDNNICIYIIMYPIKFHNINVFGLYA